MSRSEAPWHRRLSVRLFASHLVVVVAGAAAVLVTARLLVPPLFERRYGVGRGFGPPGAGQRTDAHRAVVSALDLALLIGGGISLVVAVVLAALVARRIVLPLHRVSAATRRLAEGDHDQRVPEPAEAELAAVARDVNVLAATLARTEERRRQLVTELSHELRTPIGTIGGYLEGLQDGVIQATPEVFADLTEEVRRLERLVSDLGLLSRLDEGAVDLVVGPVPVGDVVGAVAGALRPQFEARSIALELRPSATEVVADADRDRVNQILTNLVANALRYTAPGGHVTISWGRDAQGVWCEVRDDGRGMTAEDLAHAFDRFARGTAAAGVPGTGVGLTIARSLARAQGGDLTAASAGPGRGAQFTLRLPAAPHRAPG